MTDVRGRFYRAVDVSQADHGWLVLLDEKPLQTPARAQLLLSTGALAEAVADEWRAQAEKIRPETMILTKLANTAIDRVARERTIALEQILAFARSDLVCYRADGQTALAERQASAWDPLLQWSAQTHGIDLKTGAGIAFIEQPPQALLAFERTIAARDDFTLAGLHAAASLCGSAIVALALSGGRLDATGAFEAAHIDELYQWERWGKDQEALAKVERIRLELVEIARLFKLLQTAL